MSVNVLFCKLCAVELATAKQGNDHKNCLLTSEELPVSSFRYSLFRFLSGYFSGEGSI